MPTELTELVENYDPEEPEALGLETPEADAAEQHTDVIERRFEIPGETPAEVDPADRQEQQTPVAEDEDAYDR
jgi:hypothetical protein